MTTTSDDKARWAVLEELLGGPNFAALTTLQADGTPRTHVMWVSGTPELLRINTETGRAKYRHMRNDPRVTVMIWEAATPNRFAEVVGRVTRIVDGPAARAHIDELAQKYLGEPYDESWIKTERVIFEIEPQRIFACDVTNDGTAAQGVWHD